MIFAAFCILDQMSTDLLARVRKLTTGTVEIDGGKLPGSDVSTGQVIRCAVVCGIIPMTDCSFSKRGKLGVQVESPWRQGRPKTLYARPEDVICIINTTQPERQSARTAAAAVAAPAGRPKRATAAAANTPAPKVRTPFLFMIRSDNFCSELFCVCTCVYAACCRGAC